MFATTAHRAQRVSAAEIEIVDEPRSIHLGQTEIIDLPDRRSRWAATMLALAIGIASIAIAVLNAVSALILGASNVIGFPVASRL